jgi:hypothetical protein
LVKAAFGRRGPKGPILKTFSENTNNIFVISLNIHKITLYDSLENVLQGYFDWLGQGGRRPPGPEGPLLKSFQRIHDNIFATSLNIHKK